jgi:histidine triad (HIT) family protein
VSDCIFCRIANGEIPAKIVARAKSAVAFHDLNPQAPTHVLVVPVRHFDGAADVSEADAAVWGEVIGLANAVARQLGMAEAGYRLVINQGMNGGQSVGHLHVHLLGGRRMGWPPG